MHGIGLVGGTFDRFHSGHKELIESGLSECEFLEIWITGDELAKLKDNRIHSWEQRSNEILEYIGGRSSRVSTNILRDWIGPAKEHQNATAIFCSVETVENCIEINRMRSEIGLKPLEIFPIEKTPSWDGQPISSSRIRSGSIDRFGKPWIPELFTTMDAYMTDEVELALKEPFGKLLTGPEEDTSVAIQKAISQLGRVQAPLIGVGDVTVLGLEKENFPADIALIDGQTKREKWPQSSQIDHSLYDHFLECHNPPGRITRSLLEALDLALSKWKGNRERTLVKVLGEEDLAPLIIHPLAPIGAIVLYGQPGKGVVLRICDEESKVRCRNLLGSLDFH